MSIMDKMSIKRCDAVRIVFSIASSICLNALGVIGQETALIIIFLGLFTLSDEAFSKGKIGSLLSTYAFSFILSFSYLVCYSLVTG